MSKQTEVREMCEEKEPNEPKLNMEIILQIIEKKKIYRERNYGIQTLKSNEFVVNKKKNTECVKKGKQKRKKQIMNIHQFIFYN